MRRTCWMIVLLAMFSCSIATADSAAVLEYLDADKPEAVAAALKSIKDAKPTVEQTIAAIRAGRTYKAVPKRWLKAEATGVDGVKRTYLAHIPKGYDHGKPTPVIFYMHGGVSRPVPIPEPGFQRYCGQWLAVGRGIGAIMVFPKGTAKSKWWNSVGARQLPRIITALKRKFNIDENRVFVTGFSDGGSGSFHLMLNYPTAFAGAIPLNGSLLVSQVEGFPAFLPNLRRGPIHIVNTERDQLYPAARVRQIVDVMKRLNVPVTFNTYAKIGHSPAYMNREMPAIQKYLEKTKRKPLPKRIDWECTTPTTGRCDWVRILEIDPKLANDDPDLADTQVRVTPTRVRLGVHVNREYKGPGVKVASVQPGSTAEKLGLKKDDVITKLDGKATGGFRALVGLLSKKRPGQKLSLSWTSGEKQHSKTLELPPSKPVAVLRRKKPSGRIIAEVAGNTVTVRSRGVARFRVLVSPGMFDLAKPIVINVNGKKLFEEVVKGDLTTLLTQSRIDQDRTVQYVARVNVTVQ